MKIETNKAPSVLFYIIQRNRKSTFEFVDIRETVSPEVPIQQGKQEKVTADQAR